jgi:hypothetical protein
MNIYETKLTSYFSECDKHLLRIKSAIHKMKPALPLTEASYKKLDEDQIEHIDQLLFRFSKMQDTLGDKIFSNLLLFLGEENTKSTPFIDVLNRLEKLEILIDKQAWLELRRLRNQMAHEYDENAKTMSEGINSVVKIVERLEEIFLSMKNYFLKRSGAINEI